MYADNIPYFIVTLLGDAIADGRWEAIPDLLTPFVEKPDSHPELFASVIDQLFYHGQTEVLRDTMRQAWSGLRDDPALASARATPPPAPAAPPFIPTPKPGALDTYTFKVTYLEKPDVWRTIEMAGDQTLDDLHYAILGAVHFDADHLYSFFMSGQAWDETTEYASPQTEGRSAARVKIRNLKLRLKQRFLYLFDLSALKSYDHVSTMGVFCQGP